jgi:hypothetical protein
MPTVIGAAGFMVSVDRYALAFFMMGTIIQEDFRPVNTFLEKSFIR